MKWFPNTSVISAQQVGQEFAATFAAHCPQLPARHHWLPRRGKRTPSCAARDHRAVLERTTPSRSWSRPRLAPFLLPLMQRMESNPHDPYAPISQFFHYVISAQDTRTSLRAIEHCLGLLEQHFGMRTPPLLIEAYRDDNPAYSGHTGHHQEDTLWRGLCGGAAA